MKKERSTATLLLHSFPNPITAINHLFRHVLCAQGAEPTAPSCLLFPPLLILLHPLLSSIIRSKNHALQQKNEKKEKKSLVSVK